MYIESCVDQVSQNIRDTLRHDAKCQPARVARKANDKPPFAMLGKVVERDHR